MPNGGVENADFPVNSRDPGNTWPGKEYIHNGETNRPQNIFNDMWALYNARADGNETADAILNTYFTDSERTNHVAKTIREETVRHIDSKTGNSPFFIYVAATAMRGFGEQTDEQRQSVFDLQGDNIRNCNIHYPDRQPYPNNTGMNALKTAIEADGQNWNDVSAGYYHEMCPPGDVQVEVHGETTTSVPSERKNLRFLSRAFATNIDLLVNVTMDALHRNNLWENTLVLLTFDNGGWPNHQNFNWPLRGGPGARSPHLRNVHHDRCMFPIFAGGKQSYLEGGIRMHTAISGGYMPAGLRGKISNALSSNVDFWPTFSWMAGLDP